MSILNSHSRSSIDLGAPSLYFPSAAKDSCVQATKPTRSHPTRLQHSPSLPNIWFPPHSGPLPPSVTKPTESDLLRPPTPENLQTTFLPRTIPESPSSEISRMQGMHFKARKDIRGTVPSLLTPPLTPSSSIRTTASLDSSLESHGSQSNEQNFAEDFKDSDTESTRFLILGNVNRQVSLEFLETALFEAVGKDASFSRAIWSPDSQANPGSKGVIKAINHRFQQSEGQVPFVFFDIRQARAVQLCLSTHNTGRLRECMDVQSNEDGSPASITCKFVKAEELATKIGNSSFLEAIDGCFYVSVSLVEHARCTGEILDSLTGTHSPGELTTSGQNHGSSEHPDHLDSRVINVGILKNLLKSFGDLYSFSFIRDDVNGGKSIGKTFLVEYYDIRDADTAFSVLSRKKVMFGMNIGVYGRNISQGEKGELNEAKAVAALADLSIGPPGYRSHIREQFSTTVYETRPSQWEAEVRTESPIVCYTPDQDCRYCPSRASSFAQYTFSLPETPSPPLAMYPSQIPSPQHLPQIVMSSPTPAPLPNPNNFIYEGQHAALDLPHWAFENAMAVAANANISAPFHLTPPTPLWPADRHPAFVHPGNGYFQPRHVQMQTLGVLRVPRTGYNDSQVSPVNALLDYAPTQRSLSPAGHPSPSQIDPSSGALPSPSADNSAKNQLNLARIEGGHDTRTTVMIKNIPNKMNDRDLIAYIGKVCSRCIDFLYLRMDFQNGCNVGYAFVNFITVQDLLHFAKAKLGEKWNLFSSEKILQMSYANYQGKEALVEKFKNSCIMDEREAWRPKIFFSSGDNQGLPEPFPAPTHIRRKERSSFNRGALFVPGVHDPGSGLSNSNFHHTGNSGNLDHSSTRRGLRRRNLTSQV